MKRICHILTIISSIILFSCAPDPGEIDSLYKAQKYQETIDAINKRLFFHVQDIKSLHMRARSYEELGMMDEALDDYKRITDIDPEYAQAYAGIGKILFDKEFYLSAELPILKASSLEPDNFEILYLAGRSQLMVKNWQRAEIFFRQAQDLNPDFPQVYYYTGMARAAQGDVYGAAASFNSYIKIEPDNLSARYNRGFAMQKAGYLPWALEDFEFVLKNKPDHLEAYARKGVCLTLMGNPEGCKILREAAERGSDYAQSKLESICF